MHHHLPVSFHPERMPLSPDLASGNNDHDYSDTSRDEIPEAFRWRISDIYPSPEDWESDFIALRTHADSLDELKQDWTASPDRMLAMLEFVNHHRKRFMKLFSYASQRSHMDLNDSRFRQMTGDIRNYMVDFQARISFMEADILALGRERFSRYLKRQPGLEPYAFPLRNILRLGKHILNAEASRIVSMTGLFATNLEEAAGLLNDIDIPAPEIALEDGRRIKLNHSRYVRMRSSANRADRRRIMREYWRNHQQFENTMSAILDGGIKHNLFQARVHGYADCLESRLFPEAIDCAVYHALIRGIRSSLAPLHRYLRLKARMLKLDHLKYEDIYAPAVPETDNRYTFDQARDHVMRSVLPLGEGYVSDMQKAFSQGWIDVYPNRGKQSGAYSSGVFGVHPFVKLNYDGTYSSMSTLAHELGHAMHSHYSNTNQHYAVADYSVFLAEIASTFNENLLVHHMLEQKLDPVVRISILDGYLERIRATIFRQTLFAEFELAMHRRVEAGGTLTPAWLNETYLEMTRHYYGHGEGVCEVNDFIRGEWSGIPHFFYNYYVFQYSTGLIAAMSISRSLSRKGRAVRERYLEMLRAGGSQYPLEILNRAGVDMRSEAPIQQAMEEFGILVDQLETTAVSQGLA